MNKSISTLIFSLLSLIAILVMGIVLYSRESEVLFRIQEFSLFIPTHHFYETSTIYPGGALSWASAYMTQFFFHPGLGVSLLVGAWLLIAGLLIWNFRLQGPWAGLSLLVPLALLACLVQTGYWIYYMKLQGYIWVPTLAILICLVIQLRARHAHSWRRCVLLTFVAFFGYALMGVWSFLSVLLIATESIGKEKKSMTILTCGYALLLILLLPQVFYQWIYCQTEWSQLYLAGMPCFQYSHTDMPEYRYAYYALALAFVPIVYAQWKQESSLFASGVTTIFFVGMGVFGVCNRWYTDTNFHKEVKMANSIERLDWEDVLRTSLDNSMGDMMPPTRVMVMYKNLALFRLGRVGDEMFHYPEGSEQQHAPWEVKITQVAGKLIYYNYGKEQFCYRWCMEDGVEFGWSVNLLKYMIKSSLVTQDWEVARKYINLLKKTRYHRQWAEHYETFLYHREKMEEEEEFKPILPMSEFPDRLDGDMTLVEMYLLKTFSSGHGADKYYQEMTLICAMIMKDIDLFWPRFQQYVVMHQNEPNFRVPTHYQEAAYLYSVLEPQRPSIMWPGMTNEKALERIPFDPQVKQRYSDFMNFNQQCGSMTDEQKKTAFYPQFGDTFYYFYFLMRNQKTN